MTNNTSPVNLIKKEFENKRQQIISTGGDLHEINKEEKMVYLDLLNYIFEKLPRECLYDLLEAYEKIMLDIKNEQDIED